MLHLTSARCQKLFEVCMLHIASLSKHSKKLQCAHLQVAKLKEEKSWLEGQVNAPGHAMPLSLATRAPVRHLSI